MRDSETSPLTWVFAIAAFWVALCMSLPTASYDELQLESGENVQVEDNLERRLLDPITGWSGGVLPESVESFAAIVDAYSDAIPPAPRLEMRGHDLLSFAPKLPPPFAA